MGVSGPRSAEYVRRSDAGTRSWKTRLPVAAVLVALFSLALLPVAIERRARGLWSEISDVAEPARTRLAQIQLGLAREAAGTRGFLLTGDKRYQESHEAARRLRRHAYRELLPLTQRLDADLHADALALGERLKTPDERLDALFAGRLPPDEFTEHLPTQHAAFQAVTAMVAALEDAVGRVAERRRMEIQRTERMARVAAVVLVIFALFGALLVARLGREYRLLAGWLDQMLSRERAAREETSAILESITDAFYALDRDWRFTYVNGQAEVLLQRSRDELLGKRVWDEFPDAVDTIGYRECNRAMAQQVTIGYEEFYPPISRWLEVRAYPSPTGLSVYFRDVTERIEAATERERLLAQAQEARIEAEYRREELERVNESRARLIRGFTHDVRNPLSAAETYAYLLESGILGALSKKQIDSIQRIRRSISDSLRLMADLLDLALVEAGHIRIERVLTDLAAAVAEVAGDFRSKAADAGLCMNLSAPGPLQVETDPTRVRQIIGNLVSNAVKYTVQGEVAIIAEMLEKSPVNGVPGEWVAVRVRDTGPGIPADKHEQIFKEFTRLDPHARQGAGIGLAISRHLARLLGGDITLESEVGRGSTFTFWLPRAHP